MKKAEYSIFTVCNIAYLPKALVLAESILKFNNIKLKIFLFDRKSEIGNCEYNADLIWIEDIDIPNFNQLAFKYDIVEFSTSLKPYLTLQLLKTNNRVIFFDPDICTYDSVSSILKDLDSHSIILTPHYTSPISNHKKPGWNNDLGMMRFGSFNLGFYAVKDTSQSLEFLKWWTDRCMQLCYMESQFGLSTDQKWISIAPCFFEDLHISFNLGYNVAPWNIFERSINRDESGRYIINNTYPLIFFHFSNFDKADIDYSKEMSNYGGDFNFSCLYELGEGYLKSSLEQEKKVQKKIYTYDYMTGGEYISPTLRRAYASILSELPHNHNPFDTNGVVGKFAKKNHLFEKKTKVESKKLVGFQNIYVNKTKIKYVNKIIRIILYLFGPNKLFELSRLFVYLSSFRQNRGLWKF